ncbi:MAG: UTP--glucose-1-phosphate uridylyltransferase [Simkaniaceae bacterium]|nr:UTP--glucose-1-phosphate uridylyltransferase [Simkaniaceae bacterium]
MEPEETPYQPPRPGSIFDRSRVRNAESKTIPAKTGVLILAGGQGSRLGHAGPKGCVTPAWAGGGTLFRILLEKVGAKRVPSPSVAIMTSPLNHDETVTYLKNNAFFGLPRGCVDLFRQTLAPICDERGTLFEEEPGRIGFAPAGNGKALFHLHRSRILEKWEAKGISYVQVVPVDNPLADPLDPALTASLEMQRADLILRCVYREGPNEPIGLVAEKEGRLTVVEYEEASEEMKHAGQGGHLTYPLGSTGIFSCTIDFVRVALSYVDEMRWHVVRKEAVRKKKGGGGERLFVRKFETFLCDLFPFATSFGLLTEERERSFLPIKTGEQLTGHGTFP